MLPENIIIPVKESTHKGLNPKSFWFYPWGKSGVHRGVDIFANYGQSVLASTSGIVIYVGVKSSGGKSIMILGPKWRLHYYAHLSQRNVRVGYFVNSGDVIGAVGNFGKMKNARLGGVEFTLYRLVNI